MGRVVDQNVDPAQLVDGGPNERAAMVGILDVSGTEHGLASCGLDQTLRLRGILVLVEVRQQYIRAFASVRDGDCAPDPAIGAGDQSALARQFVRSTVTVFAMIGDRLNGLGLTRHRLLLLGKRRFRMLDHLDLHGGSNWLSLEAPAVPSIRTALDSNPVFVPGKEIGVSGEMSKPHASTLLDQAHRLIAA